VLKLRSTSRGIRLLFRAFPGRLGRPRGPDQPSQGFSPYSTSGPKSPLCAVFASLSAVPPSGFGYPRDGFLLSEPCRPCFVPTALLGFPLQSFSLSRSRAPFRAVASLPLCAFCPGETARSPCRSAPASPAVGRSLPSVGRCYLAERPVLPQAERTLDFEALLPAGVRSPSPGCYPRRESRCSLGVAPFGAFPLSAVGPASRSLPSCPWETFRRTLPGLQGVPGRRDWLPLTRLAARFRVPAPLGFSAAIRIGPRSSPCLAGFVSRQQHS
jgi:hypothetical protein